MLRKLLIALALLATSPVWADWASDRDASAGYVSVTVAATAVDEAIPFVYVAISDLPAGFHSALDAASDTDGHTIRVSTADGSAEIACYPVGYSAAGDTGALFFLGTGMSASVDVDYRIYCGNTGLSMPSPGPVFADYEAFYLPGVTLTDLTGNGRDLTAVNSPGTGTGVEGVTSATYNGSSQYHHASASVTTWPVTIDALVELDTIANRQFVAGLGSTASDSPVAYIEPVKASGADPSYAFFRGNSGSTSEPGTSINLDAATQYYLAVTRDAATGTSYSYIAGGSAGSNATTITAATFNSFAIGTLRRTGNTFYTDGNVTFAAVSDSARSANYVSTMDTNWAGGLYTAGAWTATAGDGDTELQEFTAAAQTGTDTIWTNITNALTSLATAATCPVPEMGGLTRFLRLTNASTALAEVSGTVDGIEIEITATGEDISTDQLVDNLIQLIIDGTASGSNKAIVTQWTDTAQVTRVYGGPTDKWGLTPTPEQIKATDSGVILQFVNDGSSGDALMSVYRVRIRVYYTPEGGGVSQSTSAFFVFFD